MQLEVEIDMVNVNLKIYCKDERCMPSYGTPGSSGFDLRAYIYDPFYIAPNAKAVIPTGIHVSIIYGYEIQIRPRSGLAVNKGVTVLNSPGTIDSDYRGEVKVCLINLGDNGYTIDPFDRIAQAVVCPVIRPRVISVNKLEDLEDTFRGSGGFGSTGVK